MALQIQGQPTQPRGVIFTTLQEPALIHGCLVLCSLPVFCCCALLTLCFHSTRLVVTATANKAWRAIAHHTLWDQNSANAVSHYPVPSYSVSILSNLTFDLPQRPDNPSFTLGTCTVSNTGSVKSSSTHSFAFNPTRTSHSGNVRTRNPATDVIALKKRRLEGKCSADPPPLLFSIVTVSSETEWGRLLSI